MDIALLKTEQMQRRRHKGGLAVDTELGTPKVFDRGPKISMPPYPIKKPDNT